MRGKKRAVMTEEEAIIEMQRMKKAYCNTHTGAQLKKDSKTIDALDMGIKAIKALEQQSREDVSVLCPNCGCKMEVYNAKD